MVTPILPLYTPGTPLQGWPNPINLSNQHSYHYLGQPTPKCHFSERFSLILQFLKFASKLTITTPFFTIFDHFTIIFWAKRRLWLHGKWFYHLYHINPSFFSKFQHESCTKKRRAPSKYNKNRQILPFFVVLAMFYLIITVLSSLMTFFCKYPF